MSGRPKRKAAPKPGQFKAPKRKTGSRAKNTRAATAKKQGACSSGGRATVACRKDRLGNGSRGTKRQKSCSSGGKALRKCPR